MHGCYYRKLQQNDEINISGSRTKHKGSRTKQIISQFQGYLGGINDQEISTKFLPHNRQNDSNN